MDQHPIQGGVVILLVTLDWVSCDGLASHPGGSSNTPNCFASGYPVMDQHPIQVGVVILLVTLCWVPCDGLASHPGGSCDTPSHFMLGIL